MEEDQHFCLKWNHFQTNITSHFETLKDNGDFLDVTLACEGKLVKGHKVILSACSPFFQKIFQDNPCKHPVVILQGVTFEHLQFIVAFMYSGQVFIPEAQLTKFLKTAELLQVKGLSAVGNTRESLHSLPQLSVSPVNSSTSITRKRQHSTLSTQSVEEGEVSTNHYVTNMCKKMNKTTNSESNNNMDCEMKRDSHEYLSDGEIKTPEKYPVYHDKSMDNFQSPGTSCINTNQGLDMEPVQGVDGRKPHSLDPRPCPVCNRIYSNLSNLRQHMRLIHNPKYVTCKLCFKTFKTDLYLRRHLISFHEMNLHQFVNNLPDVSSDENIYEKYQEQKKKMTDTYSGIACTQDSGTKHGTRENVTWTTTRTDYNELIKPEPSRFHEILNVGQIYSVPE